MAGRGGQFNASFTDPSFCPFAEELHQLQLYLEGISDTSFFNFTSPRFFIRDIGEHNPATAGWETPSGWGLGAGASWEGSSPRLGSGAPCSAPAVLCAAHSAPRSTPEADRAAAE